MTNYWDATKQYLNTHKQGPRCPHCGEDMFPQDDHGRFTCMCSFGECFDVISGTTLSAPEIPQIDTTGMTDEEKTKIPPINRLNSAPTKAEAHFLSRSIAGMRALRHNLGDMSH